MNVYDEIEDFYRRYSGEKCVIGKSEEGRELFACLVGRYEPPIGISQAAIHGREWITALLSLHLIRRGVKQGGVWVVPLVNPDGALLSEVGISSVSPMRRETLLRVNGGYDFSLWKANAEGVDLNVNFDARWGKGERNVFVRASENYVGEYPLCAPESRALAEFTVKVKPSFTVSWHTKGEEIYWSFKPFLRRLGDKNLARRLSEAVSCPLCEAKHSAGGYKDWCQQRLRIPAFTVEVGSDALSHPIGRENLPSLVAKYGSALDVLTKSMDKEFHGRELHERGNQACAEGQEAGGSSHRRGGRLSGQDHREGV